MITGTQMGTPNYMAPDHVRPEHVQDSREPPNEWRDLMQRCWNGAPDQRPNSTACHKELTRLYEETALTP